MTKNGIKIFGLYVLLVNSLCLFSQDVEFSQFYANKVYLNPAFAGSDFDPRISMNYRNQWPEINSAYLTYGVAYDQYVDIMQGGVGLHILQDEQGDGTVSTTMASGMYSYSLPVTRDLLIKAGFQVSFIERKLNQNNFIFPDQTDEFYINGLIKPPTGMGVPDHLERSYLDFSLGMLASYNNWFIGLAAHHLTEPDEKFKDESSYSKLSRKYTFHCGVDIPVFKRGLHQSEYSLAPNFLFLQQESNRQINYGLYLSKGALIFGMWYRNNLEFEYDAVILQFGASHDWWQVAYSYDKTISKLIHANTGAHEISFLMRFKNSRRNKSNCKEKYLRRKHRLGRIACPKF